MVYPNRVGAALDAPIPSIGVQRACLLAAAALYHGSLSQDKKKSAIVSY